MPLSDDLRKANHDLWERMVTHPFVREMGDGTLPLDKFQRYFLQVYLFLKTLAKVVGRPSPRRPPWRRRSPYPRFLHTILNAETNLFFSAFQEQGVPPEEYRNAQLLPSGMAMASFRLATAHDGTFDDIVAALLVTEWTYHDWATRLAQAGKKPPQKMYREWIDIHAAQELGDFVAPMRSLASGRCSARPSTTSTSSGRWPTTARRGLKL